MSDLMLIDTPENITLEADVAGFGSRCMAAMIDYVFLLGGMLLVSCLFFRSISQIDSPGWSLAIFILVQFALFTFYHLVFEFSWNGQTPGKRLLGIRVVQANGMPLTTGGLLIRNFVRLFDFLPVFYGVGLIALFFTKYTQRLGDLAARTVVIYERSGVTLRSIQEDYSVRYFYVAPGQELPAYIDVGKLTDQDRRRIVDYLRRRSEIIQREHIVVPLAQQIARTMEIDTVIMLLSPRTAEEFLEQVARAFELAELPAPAMQNAAP